jgi:hypothetical protein
MGKGADPPGVALGAVIGLLRSDGLVVVDTGGDQKGRSLNACTVGALVGLAVVVGLTAGGLNRRRVGLLVGLVGDI